MSMPQKSTVLIVEDVPALAGIYSEYLDGEKYTVVTEGSGIEILSCLKQFKPAVIILDLNLPDMNGLEILRTAHHAYPDLPVIIVTGDNSPKTREEAMSAGAFGFLNKPVSAANLNEIVKKARELSDPESAS